MLAQKLATFSALRSSNRVLRKRVYLVKSKPGFLLGLFSPSQVFSFVLKSISEIRIFLRYNLDPQGTRKKWQDRIVTPQESLFVGLGSLHLKLGGTLYCAI